MRSILITLLAVSTVGCASVPKETVPVRQLSQIDAERCVAMADSFSALASVRDQKVAKRQAINSQLKAQNVARLSPAESQRISNDLYESAILVYAMREASPATLHAMKWAECKTMALSNQSLDYSDIVAIKTEMVQCQSQFQGKSMSGHKECVENVVKAHSRDATLAQATSNTNCRTTIGDSIKLHKNAIEHARKGNKKTAISSLEQSMTNWKKIAGGNLGCTSVEKAIAIDGILRTSNDIGVVTNL